MEDKLSASGLDFRWSLPEEKVILTLDSQKTYRVFSSLLTNIVKYALPRSRVYIDLKCMDGGQVVVTMKKYFRSGAELRSPGDHRAVRPGPTCPGTPRAAVWVWPLPPALWSCRAAPWISRSSGDLFKAIVVFQQKNP